MAKIWYRSTSLITVSSNFRQIVFFSNSATISWRQMSPSIDSFWHLDRLFDVHEHSSLCFLVPRKRHKADVRTDMVLDACHGLRYSIFNSKNTTNCVVSFVLTGVSSITLFETLTIRWRHIGAFPPSERIVLGETWLETIVNSFSLSRINHLFVFIHSVFNIYWSSLTRPVQKLLSWCVFSMIVKR